MRSSPIHLLAAFFMLATLAPIHANAQTFTCGTSDSTLGPPISTEFHPFRPGSEGTSFLWRDTEFMWDALYPGGLTSDVRLTLATLASNLVTTVRNPFGAPYGDMQLIYEYFRREDPPYNTISPADTVAMRIGNNLDQPYFPGDRSHVDCYINHPTRAAYDGQYPAAFTTDDEDLSSDRPIGYVRHRNSVHIKGPPEGQAIDVAGTGWTAPDKIHNVGIMHEFQHALPPVQGSPFLTEWFSAGAEAIAGYKDPAPPDANVAYTWSLLSDHAQGPCGYPSGTCFRAQGTNYQGRTLFAAYLAYNFRGSDTTATLAGMADDLLWKWAKLPDRRFPFLRTLLTDGSCGTCAEKDYFHPGGVALDSLSRLALLHHNWRVANYVNNSELDEGQYGYPPQFGFAPGTHALLAARGAGRRGG